MQVPELKQLMTKIYGYSRGTKHEIVNKIWMQAGAVLDVDGILILTSPGTGAAACQRKLWHSGG